MENPVDDPGLGRCVIGFDLSKKIIVATLCMVYMNDAFMRRKVRVRLFYSSYTKLKMCVRH